MDIHPVVRQEKYNILGGERYISQFQTKITFNQLNSQAPENATHVLSETIRRILRFLESN